MYCEHTKKAVSIDLSLVYSYTFVTFGSPIRSDLTTAALMIDLILEWFHDFVTFGSPIRETEVDELPSPNLNEELHACQLYRGFYNSPVVYSYTPVL